MDNQINIQKENVLYAYKNANQDQKALLVNLFGKDMFQPQDIKERVKTFEDACRELGENHPFVRAYNGYAKNISEENKNDGDIIAYLKLRIIAAALNEGWEPTFDKDERRYYPWFYLYTQKEYEELDEDEKKTCRVVGRSYFNSFAVGSLVFASAFYASSTSSTNCGSRLAFKTRELGEYCGKQFIDIWTDFLFA